ncbi:MAG: SlyX family protein [Spirochaetaceae bacterium]|nr:SlyX family protein [Spirochaetaceae bacterium]MDT8299139.1 SlyX family protein [Spirochaetaceae bacterium]
MPSDESLDWRLSYLEDQVNQMNLIISEQGRKIDDLYSVLNRLVMRLKTVEEDQGDVLTGDSTGVLSDMPPNGSNR